MKVPLCFCLENRRQEEKTKLRKEKRTAGEKENSFSSCRRKVTIWVGGIMNTWRTTSKRTPVKGMGGKILSSDSRETSGSMCKDQVRPGLAAAWGLRRIGDFLSRRILSSYQSPGPWPRPRPRQKHPWKRVADLQEKLIPGERKSFLPLKEETFKKEVSEKDENARKELTDLRDYWEEKAQQQIQQQKELEAMLQDKEPGTRRRPITFMLKSQFLVSWCLLILKQNPLEARKE